MSEDKLSKWPTNKGELAARAKQKDWMKKLETISGKPVEIAKTQNAVYLVIDCSGSMESRNKLEQAKNGGKGFADEALKKGYAVGLIQFGSEAKHILEPQQELASFYSNVEKLAIAGSTNMAAGIRMAIDKLAKGRERIMCIVTDGMPDDRTAALSAASEAKNLGIDIMTIGTDDADKDFLEQLATRKDLSLKVVNNQLQQGITSMARMLPDKT
ncbi:MAG: vWA domain-containing protein [Burkholderiales bacterium]